MSVVLVVGPSACTSATRRSRRASAQLSPLLFNRYVFPFELVSLVLVAAMIGAIVLARKEEEKS